MSGDKKLVPWGTDDAMNDAYKPEWSDSKYACPECKTGQMQRNNWVVLTSCPPQYLYKCKQCGHVDYRWL